MTTSKGLARRQVWGLLALLIVTLVSLSVPKIVLAQTAAACANWDTNGPTDFTTTNVQEEGVDELDLVKTDGHYIYFLSGQKLHVVDSWPAGDAHIVGVLPVSGRGGSILLAGNCVIAISRTGDRTDKLFSGARVTVIDISDRAFPEILREFDLKGRLVSARLIAGVVYLVTEARRNDVSLLSVIGFDPASDDVPTRASLLANGWQVYSSSNSLYVAQDSRFTETNIHRFDLNEGSPIYAASGKVPGRVRNQFAMSEHEGYLRIATTEQTLRERTRLDPQPEPEFVAGSNVFVLEQNGNELEIVGQARGVAPGEQLTAARFIGDMGYLATWKPSSGLDPFHSFAIAEDGQAQVMGELHITGFSTYLHPSGEDHLIGVGREADEFGNIGGFQIQLFDVSDPAHPTRPHQTPLSNGDGSWSTSESLRDHHAFTFWSTHDLLGIPVIILDDRQDKASVSFSGVIVYQVSARSGFVETGRVSHRDLFPSVCLRCGCVRRSLFIEDYFYAVSALGVTISEVADIENPIAVIPFERGDEVMDGEEVDVKSRSISSEANEPSTVESQDELTFVALDNEQVLCSSEFRSGWRASY